jgi:hypothetical protein
VCQWGTYTEVLVKVPAHLSFTGQDRMAIKKIDSCIAPIVAALHAAGINMLSACCGHGKGDGLIELADGRKLVIKASKIEAKEARDGVDI